MRLAIVLVGAFLLVCVVFVVALILRSGEGSESERGFRRGPGAGAPTGNQERQTPPGANRPDPEKPAAPFAKKD